jgi:general L-amino acid transport system permease protein
LTARHLSWRHLAQAASWAAMAWVTWLVLGWAVWRAHFLPDAAACQALAHEGACWGVIPAKWVNLLFGHYPASQLWRPAFVLGAAVLALMMLWRASGPQPSRHATPMSGPQVARRLVMVMLAALLCLGLLGGGLGLPQVPSAQWGGLPLTLVLALGSYALSWPLALALALARRSSHRLLSGAATLVIELVRGVPLVILLFSAAFLLPLLTPSPDSWSLLARALCALTVFSAAYLAEVIRAGLQTVPSEQLEAASVLGLGHWGTQVRVVLPQALRAVLPALTGHAIGVLKESSLVMVIGLHELTGGLSLSLGGDAEWRPFYFEAYLFVGAIYGGLCWALSLLSRRLERRWVQAPA